MFKKPAKTDIKNTNVKNVKAVLAKCLSHRDPSNRIHYRSMVDYPEDKKDDNNLPIYDSIIDEIQHSQSRFSNTVKNPLKSQTKDILNRSHSRGKLNLEKQVNLPNLKKLSQKKTFNQTSKRIQTQPDENKLDLTRLRKSDNKENTELSQQNRKLKIINQHLEGQNKSLIEILKKYEMREKSLTSQLKQKTSCSEHLIIIQSLKKVIDSQLQKIIQLQRQIIIFNELKENGLKNKVKDKIQDCTPSFPPSSPNHNKVLDESNNSTQEDINMYIDYVDTFRRERQKDRPEFIKQNQQTQNKQRLDSLTINTTPELAEELLCEIDDCLDSLSRRKRQVI